MITTTVFKIEFVKLVNYKTMTKTTTSKTISYVLFGIAVCLLTLWASIKINRVLDTKYLTPTEYAKKHK